MKPETVELLNRTEPAIQEAKRLLSLHGYPDTTRTVIVAGAISQMIEHHEGMLLLIRSDKVGSAFGLARSIVESMYRGLWLNFCATEAEVEGFERSDKLPLNLTEMARAIDKKYRGEGYFEDLKNRTWAALCSYTHTGMLQLGRRFTGHNLQPSYSDEEIEGVVTGTTTCILILVGKFLAVQGYEAECKAAEAVVGTWRTAKP